MKKAKSFRELQEATAITFPELLATLTDYARGGWGIYARVVIPIIERIKPDQTQIKSKRYIALAPLSTLREC